MAKESNRLKIENASRNNSLTAKEYYNGKHCKIFKFNISLLVTSVYS